MRSARALPPAWPCLDPVWGSGPPRSPWPAAAQAPGPVRRPSPHPVSGGFRRPATAAGEGVPAAGAATARPGSGAALRPTVPGTGRSRPVRGARTAAPVSAGWRRRLRAVVLTLMVALGLALVVHAAWIPAKAAVAQVLLERAWERTVAGEARPRPWPGADTWPVARLALPGGEPLVVLAGASGRTLAFGPGHLDGTARPGEVGNVVLAGHRDTHFWALADLEPGDPVLLEDPAGTVHRYRVVDRAVVHHTDTRPVEAGGDRLTLVTCWPFGALTPGGDLRYVVTAERAPDRDPPP